MCSVNFENPLVIRLTVFSKVRPFYSMPSTTVSSNSIKRILIVSKILPNSMKNNGVLFLKVYIQTDISKNNLSKGQIDDN